MRRLYIRILVQTKWFHTDEVVKNGCNNTTSNWCCQVISCQVITHWVTKNPKTDLDQFSMKLTKNKAWCFFFQFNRDSSVETK